MGVWCLWIATLCLAPNLAMTEILAVLKKWILWEEAKLARICYDCRFS